MTDDEIEQQIAEVQRDLWPGLSSPPWSLEQFEQSVFRRQVDQ